MSATDRIYQAIRFLKMECPPEAWARELLGLLNGDHCTTADDRCVVLISLSEVLLSRIDGLKKENYKLVTDLSDEIDKIGARVEQLEGAQPE